MKKPRKAIAKLTKTIKDRKPIRQHIADNTDLIQAVKILHADLSVAVSQVRQIVDHLAAIRQAAVPTPATPTPTPTSTPLPTTTIQPGAPFMGTVRNPGR